ncbi:hypothetical protein D3C85_1676810 [compost metagenome]
MKFQASVEWRIKRIITTWSRQLMPLILGGAIGGMRVGLIWLTYCCEFRSVANSSVMREMFIS